MRVIIPFGARKITGFIIEKSNFSELNHLKEIIEVLDVSPVLTDELLQVGQWLANKTLSLYISTFQAMLTQVLKSKYYKKKVIDNRDSLPNELQLMFDGQEIIPYDKAITKLSNLRQLQQSIETGDLRIKYVVKSQITKKYIRMVVPAEKDILKKAYDKLPGNAHKQKKIIQFFLKYRETINENKLCKLIDI